MKVRLDMSNEFRNGYYKESLEKKGVLVDEGAGEQDDHEIILLTDKVGRRANQAGQTVLLCEDEAPMWASSKRDVHLLSMRRPLSDLFELLDHLDSVSQAA